MKNHKVKPRFTDSTNDQRNKRWKKGQSCASNPSYNKFRELAKNNKNKVYVSDLPKSKLTINALQKHEAENIDQDLDLKSDAVSTVSGISGASYNSVCTNASFNKIVGRFAMSNSAAHKEVLVVLEAVAELIKQNEEEDTDTDYFASLVLLLKTNKIENDIQLNAVLFLLSICIKRIPVGVLKMKFSETSKIIMDLLHDKINSESQSLIRSIIVILAHLLRYQEIASWSLDSTKHIYYSILSLVDSHRPKIRKASHQAVGIVLRGSKFMTSEKAPSFHPASVQTAKYCNKKLEKQDNSTFFILGLLADVMAVFSSSDLKQTCESILRLMTLSDSMMKIVCMQTIRKMFGMRPSPSTMTPLLNAQIISALFEYRPSDDDLKMAEQWIMLMRLAYSNLARSDAVLFLSNLPRLLETFLKYLQIHSQSHSKFTNIFKEIMSDCNAEVLAKANDLSQNKDSPMHKLIRKFDHALGYQFISVWDSVLELYAHFIQIFGKSCPSLFTNSLKIVSALRDSPGFPHLEQINKLFGAAVRNIGPKLVLEALPLNFTGIDDDLSLCQSWLLPVIRDYVESTQLTYYVEFFLPLALNISRKCESLKNEQQKVEFKIYTALQNQIWSLLPAFCTSPTDLIQAFPKIAQLLGKLIQTNNDIRIDILNSIRKLINFAINNENEREVLTRYTKNFIPILCNLYTLTKSVEEKNEDVEMSAKKSSNVEIRSLPKSHCLAILETYKCFLQIADKPVIESCIKTCLQKLFSEEVSSTQRYVLIDLVIHILPYITYDHIQTIYNFALKNIEVHDKTLQKKSYRILEELCSNKSDAMKQLLANSLNDLVAKLLTTLVSSNPTSKGPRLKCLTNIMKYNDQIDEQLFISIIPEVVMCTKAIGERARSASYNLLIEMAKAYIRLNSQKPKNESLMKFVILLLPGLGSSNTTMVACTVLAITKVIFDIKECVHEDLLKMLVESVCLLLKCRSREVVQTSLGFVKSLIVSFGSLFDQFLKPVVSSLVTMKDENHHHFRFKTKEIYIRLIRKYGHKILLEMVPSSLHKWLNHIRKETERTKKKKVLKKLEDDDDDEDDASQKSKAHRMANNEIADLLRDSDSDNVEDEELEDSEVKGNIKFSKKIRKEMKKKKTTFLQEDEDPLDFLDASASQKVLASRPQKNIKTKTSLDEFKLSSDGRLIIQFDEEKGKKKHVKSELQEAISMVDKLSIKKRKRKMSSDMEDNNDDENDDSISKMSYKSGGKGIHRPINNKVIKKLEPGQEFKAKKAQGDMKKGKLEPYAYFPLNMGSLNKRKRLKTAGQFKNMIKGAKKGAMKGSKLKNKHHKK